MTNLTNFQLTQIWNWNLPKTKTLFRCTELKSRSIKKASSAKLPHHIIISDLESSQIIQEFCAIINYKFIRLQFSISKSRANFLTTNAQWIILPLSCPWKTIFLAGKKPNFEPLFWAWNEPIRCSSLENMQFLHAQ